MEYKYIALFPGKDDKQSDSENEDGANMSEQKTKLISKKARELALQRWEEDKQRLAEGVEGGGDKVAYAMEVEYKGGAAAAESNPGKAPTKDPQQVDSRFDKANKAGAAIKTVTTKAGSKHTTFGTEATTAIEKAAAATLSKTQTSSDIADPSDSESSSDSGSDDESSDSGDRSDSDSEQVSSEADSDSESKGKTKATITTTKKVENTKQPASWAVPSAPEAEESDNDKDDFFVEEAPESELANLSATPKVYNDGNNFRFKEERKSVHEIRFAATKRKYERHKRVFNNQNKRGASDRKKQRN